MHKFSSPYLYTNFWIPSELPIDLTKTAGRGGGGGGMGTGILAPKYGGSYSNLENLA